MRIGFRLLMVMAAALLGLPPVPVAAAPGDTAAADVRLVVDVSARMGEADPDNHRGQALGLLLRMLPGNGHAGVWTFGQYVNMLVEYGRTTPLWRENAAIRTSGLASVGRRANLLEALERATWDRARPGARGADVILLSNGHLDVSDDPAADAAEVRELLGELAPALVQAGYRVHTLALSHGPSEVLEQLSALTGGFHGHIDDPAQLPAGLVSLLAWLAPASEVAVSPQGGFRVDAGVRELTVLRLNPAPGEGVVLVDPSGRRFARDSSRDRVRWHLDDAFELVTVTEPAAGRWRFEGARQDLSVYAYGDLDARYLDLPGTVFPDGLRTLVLEVVSDGEPVTDVALLDLLEVSATLTGPEDSVPLVVEPAEPGRYHVHLVALEEPGAYRLETRLWGPTFERRSTLPVSVRQPFSVTLQPDGEGLVMWVDVDAPELDHASLRLAALVKRPPAAAKLFPLQRSPGGLWKLALPETRGFLEISLDINGNYLNEKVYSVRSEPIRVTAPLAAPQYARLALDGKPVRDAPPPADAPAPARRPAAPPAPVVAEGAAQRRTGAGRSAAAGSASGASADPEASFPVWFALAVALVNLALGASVWWLLGPAARRGEALEAAKGEAGEAGGGEDDAAKAEPAPSGAAPPVAAPPVAGRLRALLGWPDPDEVQGGEAGA